MKVDLSIDFDWFIRENPLWDWGHKEQMLFLNFNPLWLMRYSSLDLVKETDPKTYADFEPSDLIRMLKSKGFKFSRKTEFLMCESHLGITTAFKENHADLLISLDAHHDYWENGEAEASIDLDGCSVDCGSWLRYFQKKGFYKKTIIVYPKWLSDEDAQEDIKEHKIPFPIVHFKDLEQEDYEVQRVFLCRSGCWVPPHHDQDFLQLAFLISMNCDRKYQVIGELSPANPRKVDWESIEFLKESERKAIEQFHKQKEVNSNQKER